MSKKYIVLEIEFSDAHEKKYKGISQLICEGIERHISSYCFGYSSEYRLVNSKIVNEIKEYKDE
jgi:hypothetical protein